MFIKVPNAPMHSPHMGEQIQTIPGIFGLTERRRDTESPANDIIIAYLAVILSAMIPKIILPPMPPSETRLRAVVAAEDSIP